MAWLTSGFQYIQTKVSLSMLKIKVKFRVTFDPSFLSFLCINRKYFLAQKAKWTILWLCCWSYTTFTNISWIFLEKLICFKRKLWLKVHFRLKSFFDATCLFIYKVLPDMAFFIFQKRFKEAFIFKILANLPSNLCQQWFETEIHFITSLILLYG